MSQSDYLRLFFLLNWDWVALPLLILLAFFAPLAADRWLRPVERLGARIARHKVLLIALAGPVVVLVRVALLWALPIPHPAVHDEFSYLLAGDTFAHGRLANPPHPMAAYLDTFHVLQHPTYASMYPPAQGAVLAIGELLGNPWVGVVLSMAALFAALLWMLEGWMPAEWALLGTTLLFVRIGIFSYWMNSYWGGAVAALGGALVMGALPRVMRRPRVRDALWMGLGVAILANSRPFEGLVTCLPVLIWLVWWMWRQRAKWGSILPRFAAPLGVALLCAAAFMLYYNWRVTQNPLLFPHVLHDRILMSNSNFVFAKAVPSRPYSNPQFDIYYNHWQRNQFQHTFASFLMLAQRKLFQFANFFLSAAMVLPLVALPWVCFDRRARFLVLQFALCAAGTLCVIVYYPHYSAPYLATVGAIVVQSLRHLRQWRFHGKPIGIGLTRVAVLLTLASFPVSLVHFVRNPGAPYDYGLPGGPDRRRVTQELENMPGEQLVIVRYSEKTHPVDVEWVYNGADVDHEKIVWARELPNVSLQPLLDYYKGRQVWLIEPDTAPPTLKPYADPEAR